MGTYSLRGIPHSKGFERKIMIHLFILLLMTGIVETVPTEEEMA